MLFIVLIVTTPRIKKDGLFNIAESYRSMNCIIERLN